jgi:hypothetical protein
MRSMKLSLVFVVLVAATVVSSCSKFNIAPINPPPTPIVPKDVWSSSIGGFAITWTTADMIATPEHTPTRQVFSELTRTAVDFHKIATKQTSDCDMTRQAKIQSVVGTIVSVQNSDVMKCTNGTNGTAIGSVAIDLARPKAPVLLSAIFPGHELDALKTKAEHFCKTVPSDLMSSFAFSELHGNSVIVSVTLPQDCTQSEVDVVLNVPATLKRPLELAASRKQGFLLHDQPAIANGAVTTINYHYRM